MRGLVTRCLSKSKRNWFIQAKDKKGNWVTVGVVSEEAPNRYKWVYSGQSGKEPSLHHGHAQINELYVVDQVIGRLE
jgi:hypothetical protein